MSITKEQVTEALKEISKLLSGVEHTALYQNLANSVQKMDRNLNKATNPHNFDDVSHHFDRALASFTKLRSEMGRELPSKLYNALEKCAEITHAAKKQYLQEHPPKKEVEGELDLTLSTEKPKAVQTSTKEPKAAQTSNFEQFKQAVKEVKATSDTKVDEQNSPGPERG